MDKQTLKERTSEYLEDISADDDLKQKCFRLLEGLFEGITHFEFIKADGSDRIAYGTLNADIIIEKIGSRNNSPKRHNRRHPYGVINYYDLEKEGWRGFNIERLVTVDENYCGL